MIITDLEERNKRKEEKKISFPCCAGEERKMVLAKCGDRTACAQLCGFFSSDNEAADVICSGRKSFLSVKHISPILISPV